MLPERAVIAFRIVERIGQPLVGMVAQMQRLEAAERIDQPDRQADQQLVDPALAGRMAVRGLVHQRRLHGEHDAEHDKGDDRIEPARRRRPLPRPGSVTCNDQRTVGHSMAAVLFRLLRLLLGMLSTTAPSRRNQIIPDSIVSGEQCELNATTRTKC